MYFSTEFPSLYFLVFGKWEDERRDVESFLSCFSICFFGFDKWKSELVGVEVESSKPPLETYLIQEHNVANLFQMVLHVCWQELGKTTCRFPSNFHP